MARRIGVASRCALFAGALALAACARHEVAQHVAQSTPTVLARPAARLPATPAAPKQTAVAAPTPEPTAAPTAVATPVVLPPNAPPQIYSVQMNSQDLRVGEVASGIVVTSSNVASVEARVAGYGAGAARTGVGRFALSYRIPDLPFFLKGRSYTLQIIARNAGGTTAERDLPITIR